MKTIHKFLQQKINLKPAKKIKSCTLSKKKKKKERKKRYVYFLYKSNRGCWGLWYLSLRKVKFFYTVLLNTNLRLKEIYHTWYLKSKENLLKGHPLLRYNQDIDQRGVRLFSFNNASDLNTDVMTAPTTEINLYIKNVHNQDNKNYFLKRGRDLEKIFPQERKLLQYENKKKSNH